MLKTFNLNRRKCFFISFLTILLLLFFVFTLKLSSCDGSVSISLYLNSNQENGRKNIVFFGGTAEMLSIQMNDVV